MGAGGRGAASARGSTGGLWLLRSGARWKDLPGCFPPCQTCPRRYRGSVDSGALRDILEVLAEDWRERGQIDLSECFVDGTFIVAKKGGQPWVPPSGAKARNSWRWQMLLVFLSPSTPRVLVRLKSALSRATLAARFVARKPTRLIGDKACDSDPRDAQPAVQDVQMIAPHRTRQEKARPPGWPRAASPPPSLEGRTAFWLGCKISGASSPATSAKPKTYLGFVHLGCSKILLRLYL